MSEDLEIKTMTVTIESPTIGAIAAALAKAQGSMTTASKDHVNPHFKSKYADLASIWDACRKELSENAIAVIQRVGSVPGRVVVTTTLAHSSGEWMRDRCSLPVAQETAQAYGSAITYARRYGLAAMVGVAPDEDDDGEAASESKAKTAIAAKLAAHNIPPHNPQTGELEEKLRQSLEANERGLAPQTPKSLPEIGDFKVQFGVSKDKMVSTLNTGELKKVLWVLEQPPNAGKEKYVKENLRKASIVKQWMAARGENGHPASPRGPIIDVPSGMSEEEAASIIAQEHATGNDG